MNLYQCEINDNMWKIIVRHAKEKFSNVREIKIGNNQITQVNNLEKFRKLKFIDLKENKLTQESVHYL